ncbi:fasciclin domain-containing protein [Sphingopyxis sp. C-1]|uniref:fasciclin domain-containing protein n=1 Tax=Sphingopyxis sp. C-1 TaxID=262667 RepID=UPI0006BF1D7C|nr:fasciclin domain-containing protein [Sphingopyxis sp. C-1]GAO78408.1 secreted and surface protein containing fasciclin-like repeats [Sphingopyxis sp. C-1]
MSSAKLFATSLFVLATLSPAYAQETPAPAEAEVAADAAAPAEAAAPAAPAQPTGIALEIAAKPDHKTLATALTAAGVSEMLAGQPFTIFAPTDQAFAAVPQPMTDWLMNPGNTESLAKVLTYHVVPGRVTAEDLFAKIKAGGGKATLATVEGETLTFTEVQGNIKVDGTQGSSGFITQADVEQSNGNIHVINGVLMPTFG